MGMFPYNTGIPAPNNNPSDDQPLMQINTDSIDAWTLIDHRGFNDSDALGGFHTNIHLVNQGNYPADVPGNLAGIQQLFALNVTPDTTGGVPDTQLFSLTENNFLSQLTGNFANAEGYQWVGGVLVQWGAISISSGTGSSNHRVGTVTFKDRTTTPSTIPFPNNCFTVQLTYGITDSTITTNSSSLYIRSFTATNFIWVANSSNSTFVTDFGSIYWVAIGN